MSEKISVSTKYTAAKSIFKTVGMIAWLGIIVGGFLFLWGATVLTEGRGGSAGLFILVGPGVLISSFFMLAQAQLGLVQIDTADYTREMLKLAKEAAPSTEK